MINKVSLENVTITPSLQFNVIYNIRKGVTGRIKFFNKNTSKQKHWPLHLFMTSNHLI